MPKRSAVQRFRPGEDLREQLELLAKNHSLAAAAIVSLVGSLTHAKVRLGGTAGVIEIAGPLEIVSATGTLSHERIHVHISVADSEGHTFGGHLVNGCMINTTVEAVILDISDEWQFTHVLDETTGYLELEPRPR